MKRISRIVFSSAAVLGLATLAGCGTSQHARMNSTQRISMGEFGPVVNSYDDAVNLGAGDALGQAIFANYIVVVRAASPQLDAVYASGERMSETD